MFQRQIEAAVEKALSRRAIRPDNRLTVSGYHPLPEIMGAMYAWVFVPFNKSEMLVEIRYPRSTELPDIDRLFFIINKQKEERKLTRQEMIDILNIQEECCRAVMNRPTFCEIEQAIYSKNMVRKTNLKRLAEMKENIRETGGREKIELQFEIYKLELATGYILPDDTMLALTNIALGADISDLKKITEEKLLNAYSKARLYGGKPSDFIPGIFTDGDRINIDNYATMLGSKKETRKTRGG